MEIVLHRHSTHECETRQAGKALASLLSLPSLVLLQGELGAGKTVFVKGMAEALGIPPEEVCSPTFTLIHEYRQGKIPLYHMDFYRLERWEEVLDLGFQEYLEREGVVVVEWGEKFLAFLSPPLWVVEIHLLEEREREILIKRWTR